MAFYFHAVGSSWPSESNILGQYLATTPQGLGSDLGGMGQVQVGYEGVGDILGDPYEWYIDVLVRPSSGPDTVVAERVAVTTRYSATPGHIEYGTQTASWLCPGITLPPGGRLVVREWTKNPAGGGAAYAEFVSDADVVVESAEWIVNRYTHWCAVSGMDGYFHWGGGPNWHDCSPAWTANASYIETVPASLYDLSGEVIALTYVALASATDSGAGGETAAMVAVSRVTGSDTGQSTDTGAPYSVILVVSADDGQSSDDGSLRTVGAISGADEPLSADAGSLETVVVILFDLSGEVTSAAVVLASAIEAGTGNDGGSLSIVRVLTGLDLGLAADLGVLIGDTLVVVDITFTVAARDRDFAVAARTRDFAAPARTRTFAVSRDHV